MVSFDYLDATSSRTQYHHYNNRKTIACSTLFFGCHGLRVTTDQRTDSRDSKPKVKFNI